SLPSKAKMYFPPPANSNHLSAASLKALVPLFASQNFSTNASPCDTGTPAVLAAVEPPPPYNKQLPVIPMKSSCHITNVPFLVVKQNVSCTPKFSWLISCMVICFLL